MWAKKHREHVRGRTAYARLLPVTSHGGTTNSRCNPSSVKCQRKTGHWANWWWLLANKLGGHFALNLQWQTAFQATRYQMADDGSKTASGTCARCQRPIMNRYTGCLEAPVYDECISTPMFYCSPVCQKADWGQHKSECRKLQARKTLGRAALLLQAIIYRIRLHASPLRFKSMRIEGSITYLGLNKDLTMLYKLDVV
jgi:hypothetical protein